MPYDTATETRGTNDRWGVTQLLPLNLSYFVTHKIWLSHGASPHRLRAHRMQRGEPFRGRGATASSRAMMETSAPKAAALSKRSGRVPGVNSQLLTRVAVLSCMVRATSRTGLARSSKGGLQYALRRLSRVRRGAADRTAAADGDENSCQVTAYRHGGEPERLRCSRRAHHSVRERPKRVVMEWTHPLYT